MGAFQSGFQMGGNIAQNAMEMANRERELVMREAADARAAEAHGLQMKSARRIEDATQAVTDATTLGFKVPGAQASNEAAQRESFRRFEIADQNAGEGGERPQYVAPTGIQPTYRPATDLELNGLKSSLAAARGDVQGMETMRVARKGIEYDDGYKKHISDWKAMPDEERSKLIGKLSYDTGVKGFGTWTPGQGKQAGYMTYLPPTGDAVKLSDKEAGEVYALSNLMSLDPTRARGELDKVSDKVRAVAAQVFSAQHQGVTANNQVAHNANVDANQAAELGIKRAVAGAQGEYYRTRAGMDRMGAAQYFTGEDGNTYAAIPTMGKDGLTFQTVKVNPEDVKLAKVNGPGGKPAKAEEVDEAGKLFKVPQPNGGSLVMKTDGMGGYVGKDAPLPTERAKFLQKNGVPEAVAKTITAEHWGSDGREIIFGGKAYGLSKGELTALTKAVREDRSNTDAAADSAKVRQEFRRSEIEAQNGPGRNMWVPSAGGLVNSNTGLVRADPNLIPDFTDLYATGALPRGLLINR